MSTTKNCFNSPKELSEHWNTAARWKDIKRTFSAEDVFKLRGSIVIEHTLARMGAERFWNLIQHEDYIAALGAMTGNQAVQQAQAGLKAIYCSGWQVAGDANSAGDMYPDQSLYPVDSVPRLVRHINKAFLRADQIQHVEGNHDIHYFLPIVADAEAGFGGNLNAYELMKDMIDAGAAAVHFEDQLASAKKCGHMGGKVLVPTSEFIHKLTAARLAADVMDVPTLIIARTDAQGAKLLTSDIDPYDHPYLTGQRTSEGFFTITSGIKSAIARALAYAPYADLVWCETSEPDIAEAKQFAEAIHAEYPGKPLAYNCSPSFNWNKKLDANTIAKFQRELASMGYKFQFVTLAGFHMLNYGMFMLAHDYEQNGMSAYAEFQAKEFAAESVGYTATKHQRFVGAGYFDEIATIIASGNISTKALTGSTEEAQFYSQETKPK